MRPQGNLWPQERLGGQTLAHQTLGLPLCPPRIPSTASILVQVPSSLWWPPDHLVLPGASYRQQEPGGIPLSSRPGLSCPWGSQPGLYPGPHSPHDCLYLYPLSSPTSLGSSMPILCRGDSSSSWNPAWNSLPHNPKSSPLLPAHPTVKSALRRFPGCTPPTIPCAPHPALFIPFTLIPNLIYHYFLIIVQFPSILHQHVSPQRGFVCSLTYL